MHRGQMNQPGACPSLGCTQPHGEGCGSGAGPPFSSSPCFTATAGGGALKGEEERQTPGASVWAGRVQYLAMQK